MTYNFTLELDIPENELQVWGRYPHAFVPAGKGGYAMEGGFFNILKTAGNANAKLTGLALTGLAYVGIGHRLDKYGVVLREVPGKQETLTATLTSGHHLSVTTHNCEVVLVLCNQETLLGARSYPLWEFLKIHHFTVNDADKSPHWRAAHYMHAKHGLPIRGGLPAENLAAVPATPAPLAAAEKPADYSQFDKGTQKLATQLNTDLPLPLKYKWAGQLSGVWVWQNNHGKLDIAGAVVAGNVDAFMKFKDPAFLTIIQEQAKLLHGSAGMLEILIKLGDTNNG